VQTQFPEERLLDDKGRPKPLTCPHCKQAHVGIRGYSDGHYCYDVGGSVVLVVARKYEHKSCPQAGLKIDGTRAFLSFAWLCLTLELLHSTMCACQPAATTSEGVLQCE